MKGKQKKLAANRRQRSAEAAQAERRHQTKFTLRLEEAEHREAQARAELARLLPGLLEGMSTQTEIAATRKALAEARAENKRRWSVLRAAYPTFTDDFADLGNPKYRVSGKEPLLAQTSPRP